jgi:HlyD family secretion protein
LHKAEIVSTTRTILVAVMVAAAILLIWGFTRKAAPVELPFAKVTRGMVVSSLSTNGKVEPIQWASARAERQGIVDKVLVQKGQQVHAGEALIVLDLSDASAQLAAAEASIATAQAQGQVLRQGGPQIQRTQIESDLASTRATLQSAQKEYEALQRLVEKQAATRVELDAARQRVEQAQLQIEALEKRRAALVSSTELPVVKAKIEEAEAAAAVAKRNLGESVVQAPMDGIVYQFDLRVGSFVHPGDLVANVGKLDQVRVTLYVDEPDLGRIEKGMPVTITWTALPGRQWKGVVDKLPTEVVTLGSRQVGEVGCIIDNPDRDLLPGTNVDAEIRSRVIPNALTIPKEALRRESEVTGVYLLAPDGRLLWRPIKVGVSSYTKAQVVEGLADGDAVALPTDKVLKAGLKVQAVYP